MFVFSIRGEKKNHDVHSEFHSKTKAVQQDIIRCYLNWQSPSAIIIIKWHGVAVMSSIALRIAESIGSLASTPLKHQSFLSLFEVIPTENILHIKKNNELILLLINIFQPVPMTKPRTARLLLIFLIKLQNDFTKKMLETCSAFKTIRRNVAITHKKFLRAHWGLEEVNEP